MSQVPTLRAKKAKIFKLSIFTLIILFAFTLSSNFPILAQDRPKLSRKPNATNTNNDRSSFRFKVSVLVNGNKDGYLYNYTVEQVDYGKLSYEPISRFEIVFPCGEAAYRSVKNLQSDGWQLNSGGSFFEPAIGKGKLWGLQFIPSYQITPNGDNSTKGDRIFGFSFISKCAPTSGEWVTVGEQNSDKGEIDVPCGCDSALTSVPNSDPRGYDDRNVDNSQTRNNPNSDPTPIESETPSSRKNSNSSTDSKISVSKREIVIFPDTILKLKMETRLTSATAKIGDKFEAKLFEDVKADQLSVLPAGCKVEGRVISAEKARKGNKSGTIGINFDRLILPSGRVVNVVGELSGLSKGQNAKIDSEGHVETSSTKRTVVFVGGGAAGGAAIGAIAGGGKGAGIGAAIGAGAGILGVLLTNGQEAVVEPGTEFGLLLTQPLRIPNASSTSSTKPESKFTDKEQEKIFTDSKTIYAAQVKLRELGYLRSVANGRISPSVKRAIVNYQNDKELRPTGLIDYPTAISLGIIN